MLLTPFFYALALPFVYADDVQMADDWETRTLQNPALKHELNMYQDNFRLIDHDGRARLLTQYADKDVIFLVAIDPSCLFNKRIVSLAENLAQSTAGSVQILYFYSSTPQDREMISQKISPLSPNPVLMDYSQLVTSSFGLATAGDYLKVDPKGWKITGRGNILRGLFAAGARLLCKLPKTDYGPLTYADAVAPMFYRQCVECHMRAQYTDIFHKYEDITNWLEMNKQVLRLYRMPPTGIDYYGNSANCVPSTYIDEPHLNIDELGKIQNWLARGAPRGNERVEDPLPELRLKSQRQKREFRSRVQNPDLSWEMKPLHTISATGSFKYMHAQIAGPLKEDLYVRGIYLDTNNNVTRHVNVFVLDRPLNKVKLVPTPLDKKTLIIPPWKKMGNMLDAEAEGNEEASVKTFARIRGYHFMPEGTALFFPKGSYVILQLHYMPTGKIEKNYARLNLFLDKSNPPPRVIHNFYFKRVPFELQPGQKDFTLTKTLSVRQDMTVFHLHAHGHRRLVSSRFDVIFPDGKRQTICNVPFYSYKHEHYSTLKVPLFVPAGSKIVVEMVYNNSFQNPAYPDATKSVRSGVLAAEEEMDVARVFYVEGRLQ